MIAQGKHVLSPQVEDEVVPNLTLYSAEENKTHELQMTTEKMKSIYDDLLFLFDNKRVYLDSHLNLLKLSHMLFTNTTYLSKVINVFFGCNLKTLLNRYRIDYAKKLLMQNECNLATLPAKCGFISRSTFYSAFAKFERVTPSAFRARELSLNLRKKEE